MKVRTAAARLRLKQLSEVNHQLHGALYKKKAQTEELRSSIKDLDERLELGERVELPARRARVEELKGQIREQQRLHQASTLELGRCVMEQEEKVAELTAVNTRLREAGQRNRVMLKELHHEVRDSQQEMQRLQRHIEIMEGVESAMPVLLTFEKCESTTMSDEEGDEDSVLDRLPSGTLEGASPSQGAPRSELTGGALRVIEEYRRLPGLDLEALLGTGTSPRADGAHRERARRKSRV